jgi:hypothetical protein
LHQQREASLFDIKYDGVQFIYVSSEQTKAKHTELKSIKAKPLNQTMNLHAAITRAFPMADLKIVTSTRKAIKGCMICDKIENEMVAILA